MQDRTAIASPSAGRFTFLLGLVLLIVLGVHLIYDHDRLLGDPDSWWHITLGADILASGHLPVTDAYSYTYEGKPFIAKEWLAQIILALAYGAGGWNGVALLTAAVAVAALLVFYLELARNLQPSAAAVLAVITALLLSPVLVARPHVFTLPLIAILTIRLYRASDAARPPEFWLLGLITLWSNLHGSFTLAFVIAGFAFLNAVERAGLSNRTLLVKWIVFLVLCPLAALLHPYGIEPLKISAGMAAGNEAMTLISEWQPLNPNDDKILEYALLATLAGLIGAGLRLGWSKTLFIVFALHMFLTHVRFLYVFFLLVPLVIAGEIAGRYPAISMASWKSRGRDRLEGLAIAWFRPLAAAVVSATVLAAAVFMVKYPIVPPEARSVETALAFAKSNGLTGGRVFNNYNYGGTLIFHRIKTFIDGRAEQLFLGEFFSEFANSGAPGGEKLLGEILDRYQVSWTLLSVRDTRPAFLDGMAGWKRAYTDDYAVIHVRTAP